jgi:hypothetical protein
MFCVSRVFTGVQSSKLASVEKYFPGVAISISYNCETAPFIGCRVHIAPIAEH